MDVDLLYYRIIVLFAGEGIFTMGTHLAKLQAKRLIASHALLNVCRAQSCLKVQISPDSLRMMDKSCY